MADFVQASGRVLNVYTDGLGNFLAADLHSGDTTITVQDTSDFDPDGGTLQVAGQTVEYTAVDDETGVITLAAPLT